MEKITVYKVNGKLYESLKDAKRAEFLYNNERQISAMKELIWNALFETELNSFEDVPNILVLELKRFCDEVDCWIDEDFGYED